MEYTIFCCRYGQPCFLVFDTQRSHVHCGVDKEFELESDPMDIALSQTILSKPFYTIDDEIRAKITAAFDAAEAAPLPTPEMAKEHVYG